MKQKLFYEPQAKNKRRGACKTLEDYTILVEKIREYAREREYLSEAVHEAIQYCLPTTIFESSSY